MNLLDLPDEILLAIFSHCNVVDALSSFADLDPRLDRIVCDRLFVRHLDFTVRSCSGEISAMPDQVVDRVCHMVLPRINDRIIRLTLDQHTMERVALTPSVVFPRLSSLSLLNFSPTTIVQYLTENIKAIEMISDRITRLDLSNMDEVETMEDTDLCLSDAFQLVLSVCRGLVDLSFSQSKLCLGRLPPSCCSSTLNKLDIRVDSFDDCLLLLDGRFECLSTCLILIDEIWPGSTTIDCTRMLPRLKCFSLTCHGLTPHYDNLLVPLVRRMCNLKSLSLFIGITRLHTDGFIDGKRLYNDFIMYLSQLRKFRFSIHSSLFWIEEPANLTSNDDVQLSFPQHIFGKVGSYVDHISRAQSTCHVYSLPYPFDLLMRLNSAFSGGIFDRVRKLVVSGLKPMEQEFFKKIEESFPHLEALYLFNYTPQNNKQNSSTANLSRITFSRLNDLNLRNAHMDYVEQVLSDELTCLPCLRELHVDYDKLTALTNNFTNNVARVNCAHVQFVNPDECFVPPENFFLYFPSLSTLKK